MCTKCPSVLTMSYKSLNDTTTKFYLEGRVTYLKDKKAIDKISKALYEKAVDFIEKKKIFDIIECIECKEVLDINDDSEYVQVMKKLVEVASIEDIKKKSKKEKEKEMFHNGSLSIGRGRNGKLIKTEVEIEAGGHIDTVPKKEKQKREISEEVREQRRQRMKKMWEEKRTKQ